MLHRSLWIGWTLSLVLGVGAEVMGAPTLVRPGGGGDGHTPGAPVAMGARPIGGQPAVYLLVKELQRVAAMARPLAAKALPQRLGGMEIGPQTAALRAGEGTYTLEEGFEDGSELFYFGDIGPEALRLSLWHGYPGDAGGLSLSGALAEGDDPSTSLSFTDEREEGGAVDLSGVSLWQDDWGRGEAGGVAILSRYRSHYTDTDYYYQSEDHALRGWASIYYEGGGQVSGDGLYSAYWGELRSLSTDDISFTCVSEGESLSEDGDAYQTTSDFEDLCAQVEAPFHVWEAYSHTEYLWEGNSPVGHYSTSGVISCTDAQGQLMAYAFSQQSASLQVSYVDAATGQEVAEVACAWDPFAEGSAR